METCVLLEQQKNFKQEQLLALTHYNTLQRFAHTITLCNTLQHTATHCNTPQHTATHCNTLRHAAPLILRFLTPAEHHMKTCVLLEQPQNYKDEQLLALSLLLLQRVVLVVAAARPALLAQLPLKRVLQVVSMYMHTCICVLSVLAVAPPALLAQLPLSGSCKWFVRMIIYTCICVLSVVATALPATLPVPTHTRPPCNFI